MRDGFGREIEYVRVSITDRCNLRCVYCMPEKGVPKMDHRDILSYEDILRICRVLAGLGVRTVKLTGGEPLVRKDVDGLVRELKALEGLDCVTLTTNGILLTGLAAPLREAGLDGVNVSLDTLDPDTYRAVTRGGDIHRVLSGIDAALAAGIPSVKVNCVPSGDRGGADAVRVAELARDRDIQVRFIELMPIGLGSEQERIENRKVLELLEHAYGISKPFHSRLGNGPAEYVALPGFRGKVGFISALGSCFCERCNRIRVTADGVLKTCLHSDRGVSLTSALAHPCDDPLREAICAAVLQKPERHGFESGVEQVENRIMSQIGG